MKLIILLLHLLISTIISIDTDLYAVIISGSNKFENFRHSINPLIIYNFLKKNNVPDENVNTY
jgi:glycosylphosphatidylinositol transamidase (GPIT) subunit GPI8